MAAHVQAFNKATHTSENPEKYRNLLLIKLTGGIILNNTVSNSSWVLCGSQRDYNYDPCRQIESQPVLYTLHVLAAIAFLLQSLSVVGGLLDVSQHVSHQCLLQPLSHAVNELLLFPRHECNRKRLQLAVTADENGQ